jgi:hypothetical protein
VTILPDLALRAHRAAGVRTVPLPGTGRHVSAALYGAPPNPPAPAALLDALLTAHAPAQPRSAVPACADP